MTISEFLDLYMKVRVRELLVGLGLVLALFIKEIMKGD